MTLGFAPFSATQPAARGTDTIWCFDAATGKKHWQYDYEALPRVPGEMFEGRFDGPHAAPAIHEGRVYALSHDGQVVCVDLAKGHLQWKRDLAKEYKANPPECGFAGAPLIVDDMVIVNAGTYGTALDASTGQTKWQTQWGTAGYAAPVLSVDDKGTRRLLMFAFKDVGAVDPANGKTLWTFPWPTKWGTNAADPVVVGDAVFITAAYDRGCALLDLATGRPRWQNQVLGAHCSPVIVHEGSLYGFNWYINDAMANQSLVCLDPVTGKQLWRKKGMGGQMILAEDQLVMVLVSGELVVAQASPKEYRELARAKLFGPQEVPVPPSLADGRLYCRTGDGLVVCLDVATK